jgi:hypothetical protein
VSARAVIERAQAYTTIFRRNARLYLLNSILVGLSFSIYSLFFNLYILARGYPKDFLGLLSALPSAVALFAAVPLGLLSDRIGRRKAMLWGTLGAVVAITIIVWGAGSTVLIVAVILLGMSNELFNVSASPFMMENSGERERTALFSASFGLNTLAGFAGSLVGGQLPRLMSSVLRLTPDTAPVYGAALAASPALSLLAMWPLLWMREPPRPAQAPHGWALPNVRLMGLFVEGCARHRVARNDPPPSDRQAAGAQCHHQHWRGAAHPVHECILPRAASRAGWDTRRHLCAFQCGDGCGDVGRAAAGATVREGPLGRTGAGCVVAVLVDHRFCALAGVGGYGVLDARRFDEYGGTALQRLHDGASR